MENASNMIRALSIDPWLRAEYLNDQAAFAQQHGLSAQEISLLNSADPAVAGVPWNRCTVFSEPGSDLPDPDPPPGEQND